MPLSQTQRIIGPNGEDMTPPDLWRDIPVWARTIFLLGAPTVAAAFLIYTLTNVVTADLRAVREQVATHMASTDLVMARQLDNSTMQQSKLDILIRIATQQCVNASTDALQRRDCVLAGNR